MKKCLALCLVLSIPAFLGAAFAAVPKTAAELAETPPSEVAPVEDAIWELRYVEDTRTTIENGVQGLMKGLTSERELVVSINTFVSTWDRWKKSRLFVLKDHRDIDVYGNLYSLQVLCRTLLLAAQDWHEVLDSPETRIVLEKAQWLEKESRRLAEPVGELITHQSYSYYLPRRVEIMKEGFPYVDEVYGRNTFGDVLENLKAERLAAGQPENEDVSAEVFYVRREDRVTDESADDTLPDIPDLFQSID